MLRQPVADHIPLRFRTNVDVRAWRRGGRIERTQTHANNVRHAVAHTHDRRAALGAKIPLLAGVRLVGFERRLAGSHDKILRRRHHVRTERRPARLAAAPAVAEKARAEFAAHFVLDSAAETGAFVHVCFQSD